MGILFPEGSSCEVYEYGYQSGCTDDAGITRGFTQGWFFDEGVQAWISTGQEIKDGATGATGAIDYGAQNGEPYSFIENETTFVTRTGDLRKFLYLLEDGSITADYVKMPDVLDPISEVLNIDSFTWNSLTALDAQGSPDYDPDHSLTGVTLCATETKVFDFGIINDGNANSSLASAVIANGPLNLEPDTKGLTLDILAANGIYVDDLGSLAGAGGAGSLPFSENSPTKGTNTFSEGDVPRIILGISAGDGGPAYQLARLQITATAGEEFNDLGTSSRTSPYLHTENYIYFFAATGDLRSNQTTPDNSGVTGSNFIDYASGPSGDKFLLPAKSNLINHKIGSDNGQVILGSDLGDAPADAYLYFCLPSRVGVRLADLFLDANQNTPYGFQSGVTSPHVNSNGYEEPYVIFRTENAAGVLPQGVRIKGPGN